MSNPTYSNGSPMFFESLSNVNQIKVQARSSAGPKLVKEVSLSPLRFQSKSRVCPLSSDVFMSRLIEPGKIHATTAPVWWRTQTSVEIVGVLLGGVILWILIGFSLE